MINLTQAIDVIKEFEGFRANAYLCPAGVATIGYGSTGDDIKMGMVWTQKQAIDDLSKRVDVILNQVSNLLDYDLYENEVCALISFVYNLGIGSFKSSTLLKRINKGDKSASDELLRWDKCAGKPLSGLRVRRICEKILYDENRIATRDECLMKMKLYYA